MWDLDIAERRFRTSNLKHSSHYGSPLLGIVGPASMPIIHCPSEIEKRFDSVESHLKTKKLKKTQKNNSPDVGPLSNIVVLE